MTEGTTFTLRLHRDDDVVVARHRLAAGTRIADEEIVTREPVPAGHKLATRELAKGQPLRKYSQIIGFASRAILPGEHVHTHNLEMRDFERHPELADASSSTTLPGEHERATFLGIRRADGRVGTRNYLGIIPSVNCAATVARAIADAFRGEKLAEQPGVDGIVALNHASGCGLDAEGESLATLGRTIAGYARHPCFAGVLLVGLGCESNQIAELLANEHLQLGDELASIGIQECGGTSATVRMGIERIRAMLPRANAARREPFPASELVLAVECGGSDAYSGISANPALGAAADLLVRHGGCVCLSETPEIYGAEHLLARRAATPEVAERLLARVRWWEEYTRMHGGEMNDNPSPGNRAGGVTTIAEKSLGAIAKGGTSQLVEVYRYAEPIRARGLVFMDTPGYDPVSVTGMIAGGANVVAFTTGRGSVFGSTPVPCLKLATHGELYRRMREDMDIDCGPVLDGDLSVEEMGEAIFRQILATASGEQTKSEVLGFGECEFAPWTVGTVM